MDVRPALPKEIDQLARLWYDAWHDSHARIVPVKLTRLRTLPNLKQRLEAAFLQSRFPYSASHHGRSRWPIQ